MYIFGDLKHLATGGGGARWSAQGGFSCSPESAQWERLLKRLFKPRLTHLATLRLVEGIETKRISISGDELPPLLIT